MEGTTGMSLEARVRARLERYRQDPEYQAGKLTLAVTEEISKVMIAKKVSRAELARRLGVSAARVTNLLRGSTNVTLKTVAAVAVALECEFRLGFYEWTTARGLVANSTGSSPHGTFLLPTITFAGAAANAKPVRITPEPEKETAMAKDKTRSPRAAKAASKVLRSPSSNKSEKTAAGSALSQKPSKKR